MPSVFSNVFDVQHEHPLYWVQRKYSEIPFKKQDINLFAFQTLLEIYINSMYHFQIFLNVFRTIVNESLKRKELLLLLK